jgi:zinc protease
VNAPTAPAVPTPAAPGPGGAPVALDVVDTTLGTGLRVVVARRPAVPLVQLRLTVPFGGTGADHPAAAEMLSATLLGGTPVRDRAAIDDELAAAGGSLRVAVTPERLTVSGYALAAGLAGVLELLADCLVAATHGRDIVETERGRLVDRVRLAHVLPDWVARAALLRHCFDDHPVSRETPAVPEVAAVPAGAVAALHASHVVSRGAVLVIVGDVLPERASAEAAEWFAGWTGRHPAYRLAALPPIGGRGVATVYRPGARQAEVRLAAPALPRTDPGFAALRLAYHAFGGYFSSRLVQNLRERRGYVYSCSAAIEEKAGTGFGIVAFACAAGHADAAVAETLAELDRVAAQAPLTGPEITAARAHLRGTHAISLATQAGLAEALSGLAAAGLDDRWLAAFTDRLGTVSDDDVRAAAARYLRPGSYTGVLVTPEPAGVTPEPAGGSTTR